MSHPVEVMECTYPDDPKFSTSGVPQLVRFWYCVTSSGSSGGEARQRKKRKRPDCRFVVGLPNPPEKNPSLNHGNTHRSCC